MQQQELIPHLFRTEYQKIVSVLCYAFGLAHIETAEDIVSETFLAATETWGMKGIPDNPAAWLYTVAKNKTRNHLKHHNIFEQKVSLAISESYAAAQEFEIDLSAKNITDSQLAMMFTVCNPAISAESQVALALNLLCGFGIQEIADAFLTNKEVIYKRINRAKQKLKEANIKLEQPSAADISNRIEMVATTLYLLFSEGYYSTSQHTILRKDVCLEAMRLNMLLLNNELTNRPELNALFALMCFHSSRFDARINGNGEMVVYDDQDEALWDAAMIEQGIAYLNKAAAGTHLTKYHLEAAIAYWHTYKTNSDEKWDNILQLYNQLLMLEYSPVAALNRTFALAKVKGKAVAFVEAEKLGLNGNQFYHSLLGYLYTENHRQKALHHYEKALALATTDADKNTITSHIRQIMQS